MIDMASVYAERFKQDPRMLQAAVMGQSPDPKLDPYTALNALRLIKESNAMAMAGKAQQPTSAPSILAETMAPPATSQGLAGMMPMGAPAGQMPPRPMPQGQPMPQPQQAPVQQASGGLAGMPIPENDYAEGGIVAFDRGGLTGGVATYGELNTEPTENDEALAEFEARNNAGDPDQSALQRAYAAQEEYSRFNPAEMSTADSDALYDRYIRRMREAGGPDIHGDAQGKLKAREEARAGDRRQGEGMALLTAAGKILKGHTLAMGASEALPAFAQQMGEVQRADRQEQRAIEQMNFSLADAQRKERMGDARGAQAAVETARKFQQDANKAKGDKLRYQADIAARTVGYSKTTGKGAGAGGGPKVAERLADAEIAYEQEPTKENKAIVDALRRTVSQTKTTFSTSEIAPEKANVARLPVQEKIDAAVSNGITKFKLLDGKYRKAKRIGDTAEVNRLLDEERTKIREDFQASKASTGGGSSSSTTPKVIKLN